MPSPDPYSFDHEHGWRRYRVLRPGRGIYHDVRRRLPYYRSDIADALNYRTVAATVRVYFVKCVPSSLISILPIYLSIYLYKRSPWVQYSELSAC